MNDYIAISMLNDYIFCPYSIYLHNVYMDTDESLYHAIPQTNGRIAHRSIDTKQATTSKDCLMSLSVCSDTFGVIGKIDLYKLSTKTLVERKYQLKQIYRGQVYQLWMQYYCMLEMGYEIEKIVFYETSRNKVYNIPLPGEQEKQELLAFIDSFRNYDPKNEIPVNPNKCRHCIYCNLCDKTNQENVYT